MTNEQETAKLELAKLDRVKKLFRDRDNGNKEYPMDIYERIIQMAIDTGIDAVPSMIEVLSFKKKDGTRTYTPMRTIAAQRLVAQNTGVWAGNDGVVWSEATVEVNGQRYPQWGQMTQYKIIHGQRCAFVGPKLYAKETVRNAPMWDTQSGKGLFMFEKNIEAASLRRAFPGILEDFYIPEEGYIPGMEEGKINTSGMDALANVKAATVTTNKDTGEVIVSAGFVTAEVYDQAIKAAAEKQFPKLEPIELSLNKRAEVTLDKVAAQIAEQVVPEIIEELGIGSMLEAIGIDVLELTEAVAKDVEKDIAADLAELKPAMTADDLTNWLNQIRECTNQKQLDDVAAMVKDIYLLSLVDKKNLNEAVKTTKAKIKDKK